MKDVTRNSFSSAVHRSRGISIGEAPPADSHGGLASDSSAGRICTRGAFSGKLVWSSPTGSYSSVPSKPWSFATASSSDGMSSESHQVFRTRKVAVPLATKITTKIQIHRLRGRTVTAARKYAYGTARIAIHLQGNCTYRSFGRYAQKIALGRI